MRANPAFHPLTKDRMPLASRAPRPLRAGGAGYGAPVDPVTGRGVRPGACDFDPFETRTYNGVSGAELSRHASDIWNMLNDGPRQEGAAARAYARMKAAMATAVWAYIVVKNALTLLTKPLRPKASEARATSMRRSRAFQAPQTPQTRTVWLTKPPTDAEWAERDESAGYDIRGTSPTWVARRIYRYRVKRRRNLEAPYEREERLAHARSSADVSKVDFIGPPTPRHYEDAPDIGMIWPPVPRPSAPEGRLPSMGEAEFISGEARERMTPETVEAADALITQYNYALEQFGEDATFNYLRGLQEHEADFMDRYMRAYHAQRRKTITQDRGPP